MAEGILSIVVGRLSDLLSEEAQLLDGVRDEILQVVSELLRINTFLPEADSRISEYRIRLLLADIRELAYDSEHVVESFLLKALSNKTKRIKQDIKYSLKIKNLTTKLALLSTCFDDYNISSTLESLISSNSSCGAPGKLKRFYSFPTIEPEIFVGFHGDVDRLVAHLINESNDCYPLISICGMGGLGKTTLARKIYNHSTIKTHFAGLAWVSILRKWETKDVLRRILICLDSEKRDEILTYDVGELVENLRQIQERLKCLIVLDDLWSPDAWDSLKTAFPAEKSASKLMITSRRVDVAKHVDPTGLVHQPELLTAEQVGSYFI